jgi:ABC-type transport system involved in Fe-S cluster assembly fused permease/ATPase subunit
MSTAVLVNDDGAGAQDPLLYSEAVSPAINAADADAAKDVVKDGDGDGDSDDGAPPPPTEAELQAQARNRITAVVVCVIAIAIWAGCAKAAFLGGAYAVETSLIDVAGLQLATSATVAALQLPVKHAGFRKYSGLVGYHAALVATLALLTKLWVFSRWHEAGAALPFVATLAACAGLMYLMDAVDRVSRPSKKKLLWRSVLRILRPYLWPRGWWAKAIVTFTWVLVATGKMATVVAPLFLAEAINQLTESPPVVPTTNIAIYVGLNFIPKVLSEVQEVLNGIVWRMAYIEVAEITFAHVHGLSVEWHLKKKMGQVIRAMDRGMSAAETLIGWFIVYSAPAFGSSIASCFVITAHFKMASIAAVCFGMMAFYSWLTYVITMARKHFYEDMNTHDNDMHDKATDSLVNFESVKYFTNEGFEARNYGAVVQSFQTAAYWSKASVSGLNISQGAIIQGCTFICMVIAAHAVASHTHGFNVGMFVAVEMYLINIFSPFDFLGSLYEWYIQCLIDLQNLSEVLSEQPDVNDVPGAPALSVVPAPGKTGVAVEFDDVVFRYPTKEKPALGGVSFTVPAGTTTAIVGRTGSGKTTLSRMLFRFYDVTSGAVRVNGQDAKAVTQTSLRAAIGIVPQDTCLFNDSIRYNIAYGRPAATMAEVEAAAKAAHIYDFIMQLDKKWDTAVGERGLKLSGGEKQRVAIARCLLKNPPVVLLDEATSALDNKTEVDVQAALACLRGRTTMVIAHRLSTVRHADQIIVLLEGRIVERGTHDELLALGKEYHSMWNAQLIKGSELAAADDDEGRDE